MWGVQEAARGVEQAGGDEPVGNLAMMESAQFVTVVETAEHGFHFHGKETDESVVTSPVPNLLYCLPSPTRDGRIANYIFPLWLEGTSNHFAVTRGGRIEIFAAE